MLVDADTAGDKLRNQIKQELPNATQLYTRRMYREVAETPMEHLIKILTDAHFDIKLEYLLQYKQQSPKTDI